ncbi:carabin isoform X2 [Grammomys surdaster]|uniref:carabin isoform X2 n=1 Tax=Grammomys surdaster TaxID=491861 RepID=UPI00109F0488|nr:carabin isoform X2 [Grammomys surdaster]
MGGNDLTLGEDHVSTIQEGKDTMPKGHPLSPACPVLAPIVWGPDLSEEQPWHLSGAGSGPRRPAVDGDHWQGLAPSVSSARDVCITPGTRVRGQGYPVTPSPHARFFSSTFISLDEGDYGLDRGHRRQEGDAWEASLNKIFWHRQQGLLQVLKAYTLYRPEQGYCQAQGPVAAVLLMHLPPEEAFWCLVQICEVYLPGYYGPHMEAVQLDAEVFMALLRRLLPRVYKHLQQVGVGPLLYLPEWFLCLFTRSLPFPTVLRIWDAFLSEGAKVLFRVGLTLMRLALGTVEQRRACPGLLETLGALRSIPPTQLQEEVFMSQVHNVALSERDLQREIRIQLAQLPKSSPGPAPLPQARLPGAQAIFESQQLAGVRGDTKPEIPRIVVQPPEEPSPPRRKPQTRGKTFHGLLIRARGPPIEGPSRSHRGSASFLDTRF